MTVKRYRAGCEYAGEEEMIQVDDGAYVSHEDYATLLAERENLNQQVVNLAVENAVMKSDYINIPVLKRMGIPIIHATDLEVENIQAQGVDNFLDKIEWIIRAECNPDKTESIISGLKGFASQLRKGASND